MKFKKDGVHPIEPKRGFIWCGLILDMNGSTYFLRQHNPLN